MNPQSLTFGPMERKIEKRERNSVVAGGHNKARIQNEGKKRIKIHFLRFFRS